MFRLCRNRICQPGPWRRVPAPVKTEPDGRILHPARREPGANRGDPPAPLSLQLLKKVVPKFRKHERVARAGSDVPKLNSETPEPRNPGTIFPPHVSSRICAAARCGSGGVRPFRRRTNCDDKARPLEACPAALACLLSDDSDS